MLKKYLILILLLLFVSNCSSNNKNTEKNEVLYNAETLYVEAMGYFEEKQ